MANLAVRREETRGLPEEGVRPCELDGALDLTPDDGGSHLAGVALVERHGEGFSGERRLVDVNLGVVDATVRGDG